jgi:hypothetical protein
MSLQHTSMSAAENGGAGVAAGTGGATAGPRLTGTSVSYAAWKPQMNVHLQRHGADAVHSTPMTADRWVLMTTQQAAWAQEELESALQLLLDPAASASSTPIKQDPDDVKALADAEAKRKAARKTVSQVIERGQKVFGILYAALPTELRAQVAHIAQGYAYGLWHWLETKFQSTEEDHVSELIESWSGLHQDVGESFDAYRARVNELRALLVAADEPPSVRMYAQTLTGRLLPVFKPAVLALKVAGRFKDAKMVDWTEVTAILNAHERVASADDQAAMSAFSRGDGQRGRAATPAAGDADRGRDGNAMPKPKCFNCGKLGHKARHCQAPRKASDASSSGTDRKSAPSNKPASDIKRDGPAAIKKPSWKDRVESAVNRDSSANEVSSSDSDSESSSARRPALTQPKKTGQRAYAVLWTGVSKGRGMRLKSKDKPVNGAHATTTSTTAVKVSGGRYNALSDIDAGAESDRESVSVPVTVKSGDSTRSAVTVAAVSADKTATAATTRTLSHCGPVGIDSMASIHCTGDKSLFVSLKKCKPISVQVANSQYVTPTYRGTINLRVRTTSGQSLTIPVSDVYYHESFATSLLSWGVLRRTKWEMHSTSDATVLTTPGGNKIRLTTKGRVSMITSPNATSDGAVYSLGHLIGGKLKDIVRLHETLGHISYTQLVRVLKTDKAVLDVTKMHFDRQTLEQAKKLITECPACMAGRSTKAHLGHRGLDHGTEPLDTLHIDTYTVTLIDGDRKWHEYGVAMRDPVSGWLYHEALYTKDKIAEVVIAAIQHANRQFDRKVKRLHADGGTEFVNRTLKDHCTRHGIELQYSPARTPQLNGVAERSVRSCKEAVRTLLAHSGAPRRFWRYAASHATFLSNRTHISDRTGVTPYEALYGKPPSAKRWGVFGCNTWLHIPREQRTSLAPKTEPCIYLGHSITQNCASVYVLRTRKIIQSKDVTFRAGEFTLARSLINGDQAIQRATDEFVQRRKLPVSNPASAAVDDTDEISGGHDSDSSPELDTQSPTEDKWTLDSIQAERYFGRAREHQYRVVWTGDYDPTWEPADQILKDAPLAVEEFNSTRPAERPSTRHLRSHSTAAVDESKSDAESDSDGDDDTNEPKVHMVMSAMHAMQPSSSSSSAKSRRELLLAVKAGIADLERRTPVTYREAMSGPDAAKWKAATDKEWNSCTSKDVWEEVRIKDLPHGVKVLPPKWVFKIKVDETGAIDVYKARITPKGCFQREGRDVFEVFANTGKYKSWRANLSLAAKFDHELEQLDVPTAFLNADLDEEVYMAIPEGFRHGKEGSCLRLKKSLYGLKQAPRNWYKKVSAFIVDRLGYKATISDPCLFHRRSATGRLMTLFLFVDDFQVSFHRDDRSEWSGLKAKLVKEYDTKDVGESKWMLGMRIARDRKARTITLDQEVYITKALEKYGYTECTTRPTPEIVGAAERELTEQESKPCDRQRYMEITGTLMYAAISTRLDIAHAVYYLACHMLAPTLHHMAAAERVMRYLSGTRALGLTFGTRNGSALGDSRGQTRTQIDVCAFADADWANGKSDRRSITGWVAKINGDPISWASKKQRTVALSTCEAELYAEAAAIQEVLWLRDFMKELGLQSHVGSEVYGDNQSAIAVTKNGIKGERTKHVDIKYHFVTETVERGDVRLKWVPTAEQQADIFTKALSQPTFELLRSQLMMH